MRGKPKYLTGAELHGLIYGNANGPLEAAESECAFFLEQIRAQFKSGVKITLLVRTPDYPERDFCLTDDELVEVTQMIARRAVAAIPYPKRKL